MHEARERTKSNVGYRRAQGARLGLPLMALNILLLAALVSWSSPAYASIIETVAGNGVRGYSGDGGPATQASIYDAYRVALDGVGNLYIADSSNMCIRKVDTNGIITTVAGSPGVAGFSGDGGPATQALLSQPRGVSVDVLGNLYIADTANMRIRKVGANGIITTVAGNGTIGYSGDGGPATQASLYTPEAVTVDSLGNLYVADYWNERIRKIGTNGVITTLAGNGAASFSGDGGPATQASMNGPEGVAVDGLGNVFFADYGNARIRKVDTTGIITTVAGGGPSYDEGIPATQAILGSVLGVAVDGSGNFYLSDASINNIRKVDGNGIITTVAGSGVWGFSGDGGAATLAAFQGPYDVALDANGDIYLLDFGNARIRWVNMKPYANFTYAPTRGFRGISVAFTNTTRTADSGTTYLWNFGDNTTNTNYSTSHIYAAKGIYSVTLTATNFLGDTTTKAVADAVCVGYIFSNQSNTAGTAPFTRSYQRQGKLYGRAWTTLSDVNYNNVKSATVKVVDRQGRSVSSNLTNEGGGNFSGSVNMSSLAVGSGTATITITDKDQISKTFTATENITLQ